MSEAAPTQQRALHLLLAWYKEMGVDAAVSDDAIDWLARGEARPGAGYALAQPVAGKIATAGSNASAATTRTAPARAEPPARPPAPRPQLVHTAAPSAPRAFPSAPPDDAQLAARAAARGADSIEALHAALSTFDGCALKATAKSLCFYRGAAAARLMVIGEAPGADEDKLGKPFVGPAGQLLDRMLKAIGMSEADTHITNIVYWRPPGNRTPTPQEAMVCRPFLERQIELVNPRAIVLLGGAAAKHILDTPEGIMKLRGKWHDLTIGTVRARGMATLHPAYLLRTPIAKRMVWRDLLAIDAALKGE